MATFNSVSNNSINHQTFTFSSFINPVNNLAQKVVELTQTFFQGIKDGGVYVFSLTNRQVKNISSFIYTTFEKSAEFVKGFFHSKEKVSPLSQEKPQPTTSENTTSQIINATPLNEEVSQLAKTLTVSTESEGEIKEEINNFNQEKEPVQQEQKPIQQPKSGQEQAIDEKKEVPTSGPHAGESTLEETNFVKKENTQSVETTTPSKGSYFNKKTVAALALLTSIVTITYFGYKYYFAESSPEVENPISNAETLESFFQRFTTCPLGNEAEIPSSSEENPILSDDSVGSSVINQGTKVFQNITDYQCSPDEKPGFSFAPQRLFQRFTSSPLGNDTEISYSADLTSNNDSYLSQQLVNSEQKAEKWKEVFQKMNRLGSQAFDKGKEASQEMYRLGSQVSEKGKEALDDLDKNTDRFYNTYIRQPTPQSEDSFFQVPIEYLKRKDLPCDNVENPLLQLNCEIYKVTKELEEM